MLKIYRLTTFLNGQFFTFCIVSPLIFEPRKATIHQNVGNFMRIPQNFAGFR